MREREKSQGHSMSFCGEWRSELVLPDPSLTLLMTMLHLLCAWQAA